MTPPPRKVQIRYFSDVLCVWAYTAQIKLDQLKIQFGDRVGVEYHYLTLFGHTASRVVESWKERGGVDAYCNHVRKVGEEFNHIEIHPDIWRLNRPASSLSCHLFLKAVELLQQKGRIPDTPLEQCQDRTLCEETAWQCRLAFFRDLKDIAQYECQMEIAGALGLPCDEIDVLLKNGEACAALSADLESKEKHSVKGSPTLILNEGRQILYGNVGYKIIEANIHELLERPTDRASWC